LSYRRWNKQIEYLVEFDIRGDIPACFCFMSDLRWEIMCGKQKTVADAQNAHKTELGEAKA